MQRAYLHSTHVVTRGPRGTGSAGPLLPTDGTTSWSTRRLGAQLDVPHTIVARAWKRAELPRRRVARYLRSTDPDFEHKAAEVIGLYNERAKSQRWAYADPSRRIA